MAAKSHPIEHVIVLAFENRSFDHMLGCCQQVYPQLDGIPASHQRFNLVDRKKFWQDPGAARTLKDDPKHEHPDVLAQLHGDNGGFVENYARAFPALAPADWAELIRYHDLDTLPALHTLARNFTVCDHWFSSVPGPTWTNRLFAMTGTSLGRVKMPNGIMDLNLHWYDQPTIFDRFNEKNLSWKVYFGDFPLSFLLVHQWEPKNVCRHVPMTEFFADVAGPPENFPTFAWIEPSYLDPNAHDDHPPHDVLQGQALLGAVYNAIRAHEELWAKTLLVVFYDEHGGFYDHVEPKPTIAPDHHLDEFTFDRLGVRVPALLISPWFAADVLSKDFDHTSLLHALQERFGLGALGARTAQANTFWDAMLSKARTNTPQTVPLPTGVARLEDQPQKASNPHQSTILALSHVLESMAGEESATVAARSRQVLSSAQSQMDAAVDRVEAFIKNCL